MSVSNLPIHDSWLMIGLLAQTAFFARFFLQWLASERAGRSVIPKTFWYASIIGSTGLLAYALHLRDPVFIIGQSAGFLIYWRNLALLRREHERESEAPSPLHNHGGPSGGHASPPPAQS